MSKELNVIFVKRGTVTNGDVIQALFPHLEFIEMIGDGTDVIYVGDTQKGFTKEWWHTPYRMNLKEIKNENKSCYDCKYYDAINDRISFNCITCIDSNNHKNWESKEDEK